MRPILWACLLAALPTGAFSQVSTSTAYDSLGRVTASTSSNGDLSYFAYDAAGNRVWSDQRQLPARAISDRLMPNESITPMQFIASQDGRFKLTFQANGELILTGPNGVLWRTGVAPGGAMIMTMQSDGNLVVGGPLGVFWATQSSSTAGAYLVVQNDGNCVVYTPSFSVLWSSQTGGHT